MSAHREPENSRWAGGREGGSDRALATLAHDIRTPLGAIDGYCALLEDGMYGPVTQRQKETLGRMRMSGRHLLSLLENVMEMARLSAGVMRMYPEPLDLMGVAREAVEILVPAAGEKRQALQMVESGLVLVTADRNRVRQIIVNLIGNATKFTPAGGSITVSASVRLFGETGFGEVRVRDSGPGIAEAERRAIFEPYYRTADAIESPGLGLGLAISQGLVRQMGGELGVDSEVGMGSEFFLRLPLPVALQTASVAMGQGM